MSEQRPTMPGPETAEITEGAQDTTEKPKAAPAATRQAGRAAPTPPALSDLRLLPAASIGPRLVRLQLGGRDFDVVLKKAAEASVWRDKMSAPIREIVALMLTFEDIQIQNLKDIGALINRLNTLLVGSIDTIYALMWEYSPEVLGADRDWIMENCYDDEILQGFISLVKASYPFGVIMKLIPGRG